MRVLLALRVQEGAADSVFTLLVLMAAMAFAAGALDFLQRRGRKGFPVPLVLYCHLLPMILFVYIALPLADSIDGAKEEGGPVEEPIERWPLYLALAPLPLVLLARMRGSSAAEAAVDG